VLVSVNFSEYVFVNNDFYNIMHLPCCNESFDCVIWNRI